MRLIFMSICDIQSVKQTSATLKLSLAHNSVHFIFVIAMPGNSACSTDPNQVF
jgi:hypothetical protein